jgi:hypothetical protein
VVDLLVSVMSSKVRQVPMLRPYSTGNLEPVAASAGDRLSSAGRVKLQFGMTRPDL